MFVHTHMHAIYVLALSEAKKKTLPKVGVTGSYEAPNMSARS